MSELTTDYGLRADDNSFSKLETVTMPNQIGNKVATMNQQGFMRIDLDSYSKQWISEAKSSDKPFLEIGAAYGEASIIALEGGATVISNDVDMKHLTVIRNRARKDLHSNLYLNCASVPNDINIPNDSIGGVLFCRVGHFFTAEEMQDTLVKIYNMLTKGGGLFFVSVSPYHYSLANDFLPIFLEKKANGEKNPGYVHNMKQYMPLKESAKYVPEFLNAWDVDIMSKLLEVNGFEIKQSGLFDYDKNNSQGKGFTGIHAIKPLRIG